MRFAILSPIYPYRGGIAQFSGMLYTELVKEILLTLTEPIMEAI